jgi:hypothetical protein
MSKKLPARYGYVAIPLVLSILMSCLVSGISTLSSLGFTAAMPSAWMRAWSVSWAIAFPDLMVALPLVRRLVGTFVKMPDH